MFHNISDLQWSVKQTPAGEVKVPSFMDVHSWFPTWEECRFHSMQQRLTPGMKLVDIGAYDGWQDVLIARMLGGAQNIILVEPEPTNWANIRATFEMNGLSAPRQSYMGFIGQDNNKFYSDMLCYNSWPQQPDYQQLISHTTFRHLDENLHNTCSVPLHTVVEERIDAINVDVEGAGLVVLRSSEVVLQRYHPLLWVSIHTDLTRETLNQLPSEQGVHEYLRGLGYRGEFLGKDHEEHWLYE